MFTVRIKEAGACQHSISETPFCVPKNGGRAITVSPYTFTQVLRRSLQARKGEILPNFFWQREVLKPLFVTLRLRRKTPQQHSWNSTNTETLACCYK
jgi:hypothetical protein